MKLPKLVWKDNKGNIGEGQSLTDLDRNNKLLDKLINVIIMFGSIMLALLLYVMWKFYSTGYFNSLLARCG